ncbi:MAG: hypothetical protein HC879_14990 [Leptolyngbyaceae cyanobacterium SL_5_9]|nr:hypothetical protein [Leptolyngbyaceae cyanobacterium SL_5_9]
MSPVKVNLAFRVSAPLNNPQMLRDQAWSRVEMSKVAVRPILYFYPPAYDSRRSAAST